MTVLVAALCFLAVVALSALFSGVETGTYTVNRLRLELRLEREGDARAGQLASLLRRPGTLLCVFLLGNNLANMGAAMLGQALVERELAGGEWSSLLTTGILTPILFVFAEALPKHMFRLHAETWTYKVAPVLLFARRLLWPLTVCVVPLARLAMGRRSEAGTLRREGSALEGLLVAGPDEIGEEIRERALGVRVEHERVARELMVPAGRVVSLRVWADAEDVRALVRGTRFSRFPLRGQDGGFVGYLHFLDPFMRPGEDLATLARPLVALEPHCPADEALARMEAAKARVAVVRELEGKALGFVFANDVVRALLSLDAGG